MESSNLHLKEHCYPQLSWPPTTLLQRLHTAWRSCHMSNDQMGNIGVFDPPRILETGDYVEPPTPTKHSLSSTTPSAVPRPLIVHSQPDETSSPTKAYASTNPTIDQNFGLSQYAAPTIHSGAEDPSSIIGTPPKSSSFTTNPQHRTASPVSTMKAAPPDSADGSSMSNEVSSQFMHESSRSQSEDIRPSIPAPAPSPPQFAIPVSNGESLSGAVINPSSVIVANPSEGAAVQIGGPATQVLGHTISVDPAASNIVIDGQQHSLPLQKAPPTNSDINQPVAAPGSHPDVHALGSNLQNSRGAQETVGLPHQDSGNEVQVASTTTDHASTTAPAPSTVIPINGQVVSYSRSLETTETSADKPLVYQSKSDSDAVPVLSLSQEPLTAAAVALTATGQTTVILPDTAGIALAGTTLLADAPAVPILGTISGPFHSASLVVGASTIESLSQSPSYFLSPQSSMASVTLAGQVFTYVVPVVPSTTIASDDLVVGTSSVPSTGTGANGATFTGPSAITYSSARVTTHSSEATGLGTSVVPYTSIAPDGITVAGSSTLLYSSISSSESVITESFPILNVSSASPSTMQDGSSLTTGGLNPSGPTNGASGTQSSTSTSASKAAGQSCKSRLGLYCLCAAWVGFLVVWI